MNKEEVQINDFFNLLDVKAQTDMGSTQSTQVAYKFGLLRSLVREHVVEGTPWDEIQGRLRQQVMDRAGI